MSKGLTAENPVAPSARTRHQRSFIIGAEEGERRGDEGRESGERGGPPPEGARGGGLGREGLSFGMSECAPSNQQICCRSTQLVQSFVYILSRLYSEDAKPGESKCHQSCLPSC